jgi:hypothetical protein
VLFPFLARCARPSRGFSGSIEGRWPIWHAVGEHSRPTGESLCSCVHPANDICVSVSPCTRRRQSPVADVLGSLWMPWVRPFSFQLAQLAHRPAGARRGSESEMERERRASFSASSSSSDDA